jgi:two-component system LytT family sensor kinase
MWAVISIVHFFLLYEGQGINIFDSLSKAFISNGIFWLLGVFLWFPIRYYRPTKSVISNLFFSHLLIASVTILLWYNSLAFLLGIFSKTATIETIEILAMVFYYSILTLIYYLVIYYNDLQTKLKDENFLKDALRNTELNLLKSQINPHFLFNSLNSISALTFISPQKAQDMIISLSDYLRYSISFPDKERVSLGTEIENIERFLAIEKIRFGERLAYTFELEKGIEKRLIPPMILQPIIENAIKHGVYQSTELVHILIAMEIKEDYTNIIVTNNFEPAEINQTGVGLGLKNCSERLRILYGNQDLIRTNKEGNQFTVTVIIPFELSKKI